MIVDEFAVRLCEIEPQNREELANRRFVAITKFDREEMAMQAPRARFAPLIGSSIAWATGQTQFSSQVPRGLGGPPFLRCSEAPGPGQSSSLAPVASLFYLFRLVQPPSGLRIAPSPHQRLCTPLLAAHAPPAMAPRLGLALLAVLALSHAAYAAEAAPKANDLFEWTEAGSDRESPNLLPRPRLGAPNPLSPSKSTFYTQCLTDLWLI